MDAVKIIKKHGSPGGLPVITAYVADNAPGESEIHINVDNPQSVETLENLQYQGQTYVVPETPQIPTPTVGNAGKVLGVDSSGSYALQDASGGSTYYRHIIRLYSQRAYVEIINTTNTAFTTTTLKTYLSDNGFNADNALLPATGGFISNGAYVNILGIFVSGNNIQYCYQPTDGTTQPASAELPLINDKVITI